MAKLAICRSVENGNEKVGEKRRFRDAGEAVASEEARQGLRGEEVGQEARSL
jgi:hypothetical protein